MAEVEQLGEAITLPAFSTGPFLAHTQTDAKINPCLLFYFYLKGDSKGRKERLETHFLSRVDLSGLAPFRARQRAAVEELKTGGACCKSGLLKLTDRLLVGQGVASDFENGILLDWIHGFPYIGGRSLKGAARAWAWEHGEHSKEPVLFKKIFGSLEENKNEETNNEETDPDDPLRGSVIFFDALPNDDHALFDIDIINTHYGGYYTGETPDLPADWSDPNPVLLLRVAKGVSFCFSLAGDDPKTVDTAWRWLEQALIRRGVGAGKRDGEGHFVSSGECP